MSNPVTSPPDILQLTSSSEASVAKTECRLCGKHLEHIAVDLGLSPLCENIVEQKDLNRGEVFYPLRAFVCDDCWLIQVPEFVSGEEIYSHYAYFSSYSDSWLRHAANYCEMITQRLPLNSESLVVEIASNDGYLLREFKKREIPCLGIEPAANVAEVAMDKGIECVVQFFGNETAAEVARKRGQADLIIANNVIGHVPDLNDFVAGFKTLLAPGGTATIEIPHALHLVEENQFDTIYQEHYSYFLLTAMRKILARHGLTLFDIDEIPTHGGSLRYYARHDEDSSRPVAAAVDAMEAREVQAGLTDLATYRDFAERVKETKWKLVEFLVDCQRRGKQVVGYGAPGKAATLLNYCGIREDLLTYTVDRNLMKQGTFLVGANIPIYGPEMIAETKPDYILILPWNLKDEIGRQLAYTQEWGAELVIPIPEVTVLSGDSDQSEACA